MVLHGYYHRESDPAYVILAISLSCRYNKRDTDALIAFNIQSTSTIPTPSTITINHPTMTDAEYLHSVLFFDE
jgi:hypothetical protein